MCAFQFIILYWYEYLTNTYINKSYCRGMSVPSCSAPMSDLSTACTLFSRFLVLTNHNVQKSDWFHFLINQNVKISDWSYSFCLKSLKGPP